MSQEDLEIADFESTLPDLTENRQDEAMDLRTAGVASHPAHPEQSNETRGNAPLLVNLPSDDEDDEYTGLLHRPDPSFEDSSDSGPLFRADSSSMSEEYPSAYDFSSSSPIFKINATPLATSTQV